MANAHFGQSACLGLWLLGANHGILGLLRLTMTGRGRRVSSGTNPLQGLFFLGDECASTQTP